MQGDCGEPAHTVPILTTCRILIFVLGVLNLNYAKFCGNTQYGERYFIFEIFFLRNSVLQSGFWLTDSKNFQYYFCFFFCIWPPLEGGGGLRFIHFGATEKDPGYLGLWDSYTGTQMRISWTRRVQSIAQTSTNKQEYWMIHVYQFFNKPVVNSSITAGLNRSHATEI